MRKYAALISLEFPHHARSSLDVSLRTVVMCTFFPPADSHPQTQFREATHGSWTEKQQHEPKTNLPKTDDA